ncbi:MAG TPA: rhomboid family intramembrane serine protease [Candidatus Dormibacteraeota bacterium]|nr:rhomboid family intramembrane serine protease [Candidatus Dormibacteraeota bacterium]
MRSLGRSASVTSALITVNVIVWLVGVVLVPGVGLISGSPLAGIAGLSARGVAAGDWWRAITAGFLHSGLLHLGFNMVVLYMLGPPLEGALGRIRFTVLYFTALIASSLGALLLTPNALTVGASGAIFGLMGAVVVGQRASGIDPRRSGILTWIVINLVFTVVVPGVSIGGHLGGLAGGLIAGSLLFRRSLHPAAAIGGCIALAALCFVALLQVAGHPVRG